MVLMNKPSTFLLLLIISICNGDEPAQHRRKITGRMIWPSFHHHDGEKIQADPSEPYIPAASYSRQMLIKFPSFPSTSSTIQQTIEEYSSHPQEPRAEQSVNINIPNSIPLPITSAKESPAEQPTNKVALLQQLLRLAPQAIENGTYDKCNHPFHSWLCNRANVRQIITPPPTPPSLPPPPPPPSVPVTTTTEEIVQIPEASIDEGQLLIPEILLPPPSTLPPVPPTTPKITSGWDDTDSCSHSFHSWLCAKRVTTSRSILTSPLLIKILTATTAATTTTTPEPPLREQPAVPDASNLEGNLLLPVTEATTTVGPLPLTKNVPTWDGVDPCTHAFHSWLCAKNSPRTTTIRPIEPVVVPDASNPQDSLLIPQVETTTISRPTTTTFVPVTSAPKIILPAETVKTKSWDENTDSCSHPFHSWLCAKPKARTTTTTTSTTTTTTTTTTPVPPPLPVEEEPIVVEPDASIREENLVIQEVETTTKSPPLKTWDESDSCNHPFHSWLCNKSPKIVTTPPPPPPTTTVPPPIITVIDEEIEQQPDPDSSNFGDILLEIGVTTRTPVLPPLPAKTSPPSGWQGQDPCTHPFHSWLCNRYVKKENSRPNPGLRIGRESVSSSAIDEWNAEESIVISSLENFESKRLYPLGRVGLFTKRA